ncbi:MAG TPA: hypothetical protein VIN38_00190 [Thiobacillus sp.]
MTGIWRYFFALVLCTTGNVAADSGHPNDTAAALQALLAASNQTIPESSTCHGTYFPGRQATVKDLVAVQLAYLQSGDNVISGSCTKQKCSLEIRHANGEDVSYASIAFDVRNGAACASTLACVITP